MRRHRNVWVLLISVLCGAIIGGLAGELLSVYPFFRWMSLGSSSGFRELLSVSLNPIDAYVIRLGFSFAIRINAGSLIGIFVALVFYYSRR